MPAPIERTFQTLRLPDGNMLAYERVPGAPDVVFLHGLHSDRGGTKAIALEDHARARGYGLIRFDMFGHGASSGRFEQGTISRWIDDALAVIDKLTQGPVILIGSSMGGWVMLKAAVARPDRIAGLIGIAAAPDFTEELMWASCTPAQKEALATTGYIDMPSEYDEDPYRISRSLIEDGRKNLLLGGAIQLDCPIRLLQGKRDTSVPWQTAERIAARVTSKDVRVTLIDDGDHRLSRAEDLALLCASLDELVTTTGRR